MKKENIIQSLQLLCALILLASCSSMKVDKSQLVAGSDSGTFLSNKPSTENTLVYRNTALTLPEEWSFLLPHRSENEIVSDQPGEVLYRFLHPNEELSGLCVVFDSDKVDSRVPRLAKFYAEALPEGYEIYNRVQTQLQQRKATIIHGGNKEAGVSYISLLDEYEGSTYVVEIAGPEEVIFDNAETISLLLHSFALIDGGGFSMRNRPQQHMQFNSFAGPWQWYEDLPKGFSLFTTIDDKQVVAAIDTSQHKAAQFQDMYPFSRSEEYVGELIINNLRQEVVFHAGMISRSSGRMACEVKANGSFYRIVIHVYGVKNIEELIAVHSSDSVQQLFAENVVFR